MSPQRLRSLGCLLIFWTILGTTSFGTGARALDGRQAGQLAPPEGIALPERGISSHRGSNHTHPENTLPAFQEAIRAGAHQIELDVYLTDHGDLVVIHDRTVDRTSDGRGDVRQMTLAEIRRLDAGSWKDERFAGVRIPTLDEALEIMPHNVWLNLHLKGGYELGSAVAKKVLEHRRAYQAFLAAGRDAANGARSVFAEILICNMTRRADLDRYVEETIQHGDAFIQFRGRDGMPTPAQIHRLKEAGVRINYFGTNDPEELERLYELGIQFPLVDDLHPMMERAEQLGIPRLDPVFLP